MICFPNAKINIGLNITGKRTDGYHNLETVFYPVSLKDILEFVETKNNKTTITVSGTDLKIPDNDNICIKTYNLLKKDYKLPALNIYLHKNIPHGAGLGGGSSDAAFFLKSLNEYFSLNIEENKLIDYAVQLGADCSFFIKNKAVFAEGTGNLFKDINLSLSGYFIAIVKPDFSISTKEAFQDIIPKTPEISLKSLIQQPLENWKNTIVNDFETGIFKKYNFLYKIKQKLYDNGAIYASMSGSGSALYGIFKDKPGLKKQFSNMFYREKQLD